jgi:uracil-DNA glycosylase
LKAEITIDPKIEETWKIILSKEFSSDYFLGLKKFLIQEKSAHTVFPPGDRIFAAFNHTPFDKVKLVILGQDPYHGPGQAHGLCFSVPRGIRIPPSLLNIYKEIKNDLEIDIPAHGNLEYWAKQGVLLLNATLTVRAHSAGSHQGKGWEQFTDSVIRTISEEKENVVFLLWGRYAQNKAKLINQNKHLILKSVHPSPLSAYNGFFGCKHFSQTNNYLKSKGVEEIDWSLPK